MAENVYSSAKIVRSNDNIQKFELNSFGKNKDKEVTNTFVETKLSQEIQEEEIQEQKIEESQVQTPLRVDNTELIEKIEPIYAEFSKLYHKIDELKNNFDTIKEEGLIKAKDLDLQVVKAIKDLKQYASFFEQASFQLENKLLRTSIAIAKKIINIELGENSSKIAKETITQLLKKVKNASKVKIHLNPKDYHILKKDLELEHFIELFEDANVVAGGVVIASDLGNYDGSVEARLSSMLESLDLVI